MQSRWHIPSFIFKCYTRNSLIKESIHLTVSIENQLSALSILTKQSVATNLDFIRQTKLRPRNSNCNSDISPDYNKFSVGWVTPNPHRTVSSKRERPTNPRISPSTHTHIPSLPPPHPPKKTQRQGRQIKRVLQQTYIEKEETFTTADQRWRQ